MSRGLPVRTRPLPWLENKGQGFVPSYPAAGRLLGHAGRGIERSGQIIELQGGGWQISYETLSLDISDGRSCKGQRACARYVRRGETLPSKKARTPLVELPLGATEDRICGTIDIEKALMEGKKVMQPLARHRSLTIFPHLHVAYWAQRKCTTSHHVWKCFPRA